MSAASDMLLDVRGLRIGFGGQAVVHGIDFSVKAGEKLALVGESGSGKTVSALSLLRLVPDSHIQGQAHFMGRDLLQLSERELRGVRGDDRAVHLEHPRHAVPGLQGLGDRIMNDVPDRWLCVGVLGDVVVNPAKEQGLGRRVLGVDIGPTLREVH
jgi:microcin C transport system ATP-binding protein